MSTAIACEHTSEPPPLPIRELEAQITELTGHLNAASHRWLTLIAEFDDRKGWHCGATQSCAHWLNYRCGIDLGAAREKLRVAHALKSLPRISSAMARGELSYSKVRALTRVATEATEESLLNIALYGTAHHVETVVRHFRRAQEAEALCREARQHATRELTHFFDDDGSLILKARLPAEAGMLVIKALEAAMEQGRSAERAAVSTGVDVSAETSPARGGQPSRSMRRADALAVVAESFLKHGLEALSGGERHQIVVHVEARALGGEAPGCCDIEHGPSLPAETARRLACDASVVKLVENEKGEPLSIGRKTRVIPPAIRRALNARDKGCRFPGCPNKRYVDGHHIQHWTQGGETKLSNLVSLCRFHHRQVHEGGVRIEVLNDGALRFFDAHHQPFDATTAPSHIPSDWTQLPDANRAHALHITKDTATSRWRGESIDYGLAIDVLLQRASRARNVSAETPSGASIE